MEAAKSYFDPGRAIASARRWSGDKIWLISYHPRTFPLCGRWCGVGAVWWRTKLSCLHHYIHLIVRYRLPTQSLGTQLHLPTRFSPHAIKIAFPSRLKPRLSLSAGIAQAARRQLRRNREKNTDRENALSSLPAGMVNENDVAGRMNPQMGKGTERDFCKKSHCSSTTNYSEHTV